jgi:hypothetical protein
MAIQALIPYALAAYGGYKGYRGAKKSGASGLQSILAGAAGAYTGYNLGAGGMNAMGMQNSYTPFLQTQVGQSVSGMLPASMARPVPSSQIIDDPNQSRSILDILKSQNAKGDMVYDPLKVSTAIAGGTFLSGAFDQGPVDTYSPGYNMGYLDMKNQRPGYTYIDPETGQEKAYEKIYSPEESGIGDPRIGPYSYTVQKFNTGGITNIKKFNEGGVNYLPSKVSHDENDSNNYVRASGYVEDGEGVGDKDEDTMLAQLADGEFVTRADGVLGAGIIAGGNPNSMKDMREKGAQYFYEQQKRYKRVFDLLKDRNGIGKEKTN